MFGYVRPDNMNLYVKDFFLYRSVYCGICINLKKNYGNVSRFSLTYDSVFLSLVLHNFLGEDYDVKMKRCILHWLRRRQIASPNEIDKIVASINLLLVKYKLKDDVMDGKRRLFARLLFRRATRKAARNYPQIDKAIKAAYENLSTLEKAKCTVVDQVAECFALMLVEVVKIVLGEKCNEQMTETAYNLGKWIYLIDAVDDLEKDFKKGNYNVFLESFGDFENRKQFVEKHRADLQFYLNISANLVDNSLKSLKFPYNCDIIYNISDLGLKLKNKQILEKRCKCKKIST